MQIGIGLPATISGVQGQHLLDWARIADTGPFSSLGIIDRLVYTNYEPLITLAAVAGATERIRLMTTILIAPLHTTGMLIKQVSSLDALSGGRLTLGVAVGGREDDFHAAPAPFHHRGKRFEEQLDAMKRMWSTNQIDQSTEPIGPIPIQQGGPLLLIGGQTPAALQRVGRWGDGIIVGGNPVQALSWYRNAEMAWQAANRPGKPRFVGGMYFGLGPDAAELAGAYIRRFYAFAGPIAEQIARGLPTSPEVVKQAIRAFADIGVDELMLWPCISNLDQIDRLADLIA